jgi:type IV pilus assembly protein PilE
VASDERFSNGDERFFWAKFPKSRPNNQGMENISHARYRAGFTLIELMIVMAIAAILAAIALPAYQSSVRKGRRSDAIDATAAVQLAQERWRANNPSYSTEIVDELNLGTTLSKSGYYQLSLSDASGTGYTLTATAVTGKGQENDSGCSTLTLTVTNGSATHADAGCWSH